MPRPLWARTPGRRRLLASLAGAAVLAAAGPAAPAHAADALSISVPPRVVEEQAGTIDVTVTADTAGVVRIDARPASQAPCPRFAAANGSDDPNGSRHLAAERVPAGTTTLSVPVTFPDGGRRLVCAYLDDDSAVLSGRAAASAETDVAENPASVSLTFGAPPAVGQPLLIDTTGTSAAGRVLHVFVLAGPRAAWPCSRPDGKMVDAARVSVVQLTGGPFTAPRITVGPDLTPWGEGYRMCAYVVEGADVTADGSIEAVTTFDLVAPAPPPVPQPAADVTAPRLTRIAVTRATIRIDVSEAARVGLRAERRLAGVRTRAKRYVTPTKASRRLSRRRYGRVRSCTRYVVAAETTFDAVAGRNVVPFAGRIGARRLRTGTYRLVVSAVDAAQNAARPRTAAFRVGGRPAPAAAGRG